MSAHIGGALRAQYVGGGTVRVMEDPRLSVTVTRLGGTWTLALSNRKPSSEVPLFAWAPIISLPVEVANTE
jgi:hypothetical protein